MLGSMPASDLIVTTNAGIELCTPHFYYLNDEVACHRYAQAGRESEAVCMTADRCASGLQVRGITDYHPIVPMVHPVAVWSFLKGTYTYHPLSGVMCVQIAVNLDADLVRLVGFDGYTETERLRAKNQMQAEALQAIVDACPHVTFEWYGDSLLDVRGANVIRVGSVVKAA